MDKILFHKSPFLVIAVWTSIMALSKICDGFSSLGWSSLVVMSLLAFVSVDSLVLEKVGKHLLVKIVKNVMNVNVVIIVAIVNLVIIVLVVIIVDNVKIVLRVIIV